MNTLSVSFKKLLSLLRVRMTAAGIEVSDQVVRFAKYDGKEWRMAAVRLEPGVLEKGKIKDPGAFASALQLLKAKASGRKDAEKKKINVVVALSSVGIYTQTFTLPLIEEGAELDNAITLNMQMISPIDIAQSYAGSAPLARDEENLKLEMAAAFADKQTVDDIMAALFAVGFRTVSVESRAFALMRILREKGSGIDTRKAYLLVNIDNTGMSFLIVRKGAPYFEYESRWSDLADESGEVPVAVFENTLAGSLRQVMNFYAQHWPEPIGAVILSASALEDTAEKAIKSAASLPVIRLSLRIGQQVSSEWLVALGCGLRGFASGGHDKEMNILGHTAEAAFLHDQVISFLNLWRVIVPVALGLLMLTLGIADNFLSHTRSGITSQSGVAIAPAEAKEIADLQATSTAFNQLILLVQAAEKSGQPKYKILDALTGLAVINNVTVTHLSFQNIGAPILLAGTASVEDNILALKSAIEKDPRFGTVNLPLTSISQSGVTFSFSMTFPVSASVFQ